MFFFPSSIRRRSDPLEEAIFRASHEGDLRRMQNLILEHPNVNFTARNGSTPLCCASYKGFLHCVQWLVQSAGADFHQTTRDSYAITPLYAAAQEGHTPIVRFLISHGADYQSKNWQTGYTPLQIGAVQGHVDTVRCIASELGTDTLIKSKEGEKAFLLAFMKEHYAVMECLIQEFGISPDFHFANGQTPLCHAITRDNLHMVKFLIRMKANVDFAMAPSAAQSALKILWERVTVGEKCWSSSIWRRLAGIARHSIYQCDSSPLEMTVSCSNDKLVRLLLENGAKLDRLSSSCRSSYILTSAIETGSFPVVQALVEHGALNSDNESLALMTACRTGQATMFQYLTIQGRAAATLFHQPLSGSPRLLSTACELRHPDIAFFILSQTMRRGMMLGGA